MTMTAHFLRSALLDEVRSWLGTPWHHQAAVKGVGYDCIGFVCGAAEPFIGKVDHRMDYAATWLLYRAEPLLYAEFKARAKEIKPDRAKPGDVLLFGVGKGPAHHCGYVAENGQLLHCYREAGQVVEQDLTDFWRSKIRHAFRLPGIVDR